MQKNNADEDRERGKKAKVLALPPLKVGWIAFLICAYIEMLVK